ncbi:MAG: transporter substrate-binding protein [Chloroflexi bacterium]|nr:transporter substrate-binding protein [Chloroflexota bacterium]
MPKRWLFPWLTSLSILLSACTPDARPSAQQPPSQTSGAVQILRVASLGAPPRNFHPYPEPQEYNQPLVDAWTLMGAGLIGVDYDKQDWVVDPRTDMARELPTVSNDGRTFTFILRDDIKWSDGKPIVADDFVFAFENARKEENNFIGLDDLLRIESVRTPTQRTLEVTLDQTYARFIAVGFATLGPVPKHIWEGKPWLDPQGNPEILKPTVVNGPYVLKEVNADHHAYTRNPNWWGKRPNFDEVTFLNAGPQTALELLKTRQADWTQNVPPSQYADAKVSGNVNVVEWTGATGSYRLVLFNLQRPFLSDKRVREALSRAINRQDLVQFEEGLATPQFGLYPQGNTKWLNTSVERYEFDLSRSRQLLQDAGYRLDGTTLRDASGQPVKIEIIWPTTSQPRGKIAAYLQQQWKGLGVDVVVTGLEFATFADKYSRQRDYDVAMGTYGGGSFDPDTVKEQYRTNGTQNTGGYSNPRVDQLLEQGLVEQDESRRKQIYDEIQRLVVDDLPSFQMVTLKGLTAFDRRVTGVSPGKGGDILQQNNMQILDWSLAQ